MWNQKYLSCYVALPFKQDGAHGGKTLRKNIRASFSIWAHKINEELNKEITDFKIPFILEAQHVCYYSTHFDCMYKM